MCLTNVFCLWLTELNNTLNILGCIMHKSKADSPAARSLFGAFSRREKSWQSWQFGRKQIKKKFGHLTPNFDITNEQVSYHGLKKYLFTRQSGHLVWLATWKVAALTNALCPTLSNFAGRKKRSHKHSGGQGTVWQKKKKRTSFQNVLQND